MLVEDLIEELRGMPPTAVVEVRIRKNESADGGMEALYEFRTAPIVTVVYGRGVAAIQLDE